MKKLLNKLEKATGIDIDGDGKVRMSVFCGTSLLFCRRELR